MGVDYSTLVFKPEHPSSTKGGAIQLQLTSSSLQLPDELISGVVHLQLNQPFPPS